MRGLFILLLVGIAFAAPAPLQNMVNDETRECSSFSAGDECTRCLMPDGWRGIGMAPCPKGYANVEADRDCSVLKSEFCCSQGHSGGQGDCTKLLINPERKECVFSDEARCAPSPGWAPAKGLCPEGYAWSDSTCDSDRGCGFAAALLIILAMAFIFIRIRAR